MRSLRRRAVPSPSIVVAIVALVVALAGTAFAQTVLPRNSVGPRQLRTGAVTSSDIKDRTIRLTDISRTARSQLRGQQGPAGPPGPPGASGTGTGTGAVNLVVQPQAGTVQFGQTNSTTATCPAGRRVTGGGARVDTGTDVSVRESYPSGTNNSTSWTVRMGNDDVSGIANYTVFAICAA